MPHEARRCQCWPACIYVAFCARRRVGVSHLVYTSVMVGLRESGVEAWLKREREVKRANITITSLVREKEHKHAHPHTETSICLCDEIGLVAFSLSPIIQGILL